MAVTTRGAQSRHWTDVIAIFTGVALLGLAIWPGDPSASAGATREAGNPQLLWGSHVVAGVAALGAVFVAQRWQRRPLARAMLIVGALALIAVLFVFNDFGARALLTTLLPALLLLVASTGVGPMPRDL
jgi:peptidoglycan/LPS O-acetylase OafA/YrhL